MPRPGAKGAAWHIPRTLEGSQAARGPTSTRWVGREVHSHLAPCPSTCLITPLQAHCLVLAICSLSRFCLRGLLLITKREMVLILINTIKGNSLGNPPSESSHRLIGEREREGEGEEEGREGDGKGEGGDTDDLLGDRHRLEG